MSVADDYISWHAKGGSMNKMRNSNLNAIERLNRKFTLNPLIRTKLIWFGRIWIADLINMLGKIIEKTVKGIIKIILIIVAAFFFV